MPTSTPLGSVPQEVLEQIAFFAATCTLVGPPSGLPPLLLTCRAIYQALSFEANPYLYARIFHRKFDTDSVSRRLGSHVSVPRVLANELTKRWTHLKRIRARTNSLLRRKEPHKPQSSTPTDLLWLSYLMMLENDGKNERQLLDYAEMDVWLMEYWFDIEGASSAMDTIRWHTWPAANENNSIAMWLFWFLLRPNRILRNMSRFPHIKTVIKLMALAANHYPICHPSWTEFLPRPEAISPPSIITHFSESYRLNPPTLAPAAVLTFLSPALRMLPLAQVNHARGLSLQLPASLPPTVRRSEDWDTDWFRCVNLGQPDPHGPFSGAYVLGSVEGVWEGAFTYMEFSTYSFLLSGGAPPVLDHCPVGSHQQTWRLREYYLPEYQQCARETSQPLAPGDPLNAHVPIGVQISREFSDSVEIREPDTDAVRYWRPFHAPSDGHNVIDIIILGEVSCFLVEGASLTFCKGHSAWGQFNLHGRVRLRDGLISLAKEYTHGDRGRWLYRGYLVGNADGHISGRWRDTLSPSDLVGYEGCFAMSRRR